MYHKKKDRFSIRKFKIGVGSIFLGSFLLVTPQVFASEKENPDTLTSVQPLAEASGLENPTSPKAGKTRAKEDKKEDKQEDKEKASAQPSGAEAKTGDQDLEKGESLKPAGQKSPANLGSENKKAEDREATEEKTEEKAEEKERHITIEDFKNMAPEDLKKLTFKDFEDLKPSQEVVDSLSDEQKKALQESEAYQEYKKASKPLRRTRRAAQSNRQANQTGLISVPNKDINKDGIWSNFANENDARNDIKLEYKFGGRNNSDKSKIVVTATYNSGHVRTRLGNAATYYLTVPELVTNVTSVGYFGYREGSSSLAATAGGTGSYTSLKDWVSDTDKSHLLHAERTDGYPTGKSYVEKGQVGAGRFTGRFNDRYVNVLDGLLQSGGYKSVQEKADRIKDKTRAIVSFETEANNYEYQLTYTADLKNPIDSLDELDFLAGYKTYEGDQDRYGIAYLKEGVEKPPAPPAKKEPLAIHLSNNNNKLIFWEKEPTKEDIDIADFDGDVDRVLVLDPATGQDVNQSGTSGVRLKFGYDKTRKKLTLKAGSIVSELADTNTGRAVQTKDFTLRITGKGQNANENAEETITVATAKLNKGTKFEYNEGNSPFGLSQVLKDLLVPAYSGYKEDGSEADDIPIQALGSGIEEVKRNGRKLNISPSSIKDLPDERGLKIKLEVKTLTGATTVVDVTVNRLAKEAAKTRLDKIAEDTKREIQDNRTLTSQEKTSKQNEVDTKLQEAKRNIDRASSVRGVDAAEQAGKEAIRAIVGDSKVKIAARDEIDRVARERKTVIENKQDPGDNLTEDERREKLAEVDDLASQAKSNITSAREDQDVEIAKETGTQAINAVSTRSPKKMQASADLNQAKTDAYTAIGGYGHLSPEQTRAAKQEVDRAVADAIAAANDATTNNQVDNAIQKGTKKVELAKAKAEAIDGILARVEAENALIDNEAGLTPEQKRLAKAEVKKEADKVIASVNGVTYNDADPTRDYVVDVTSFKTAGLEDVGLKKAKEVAKKHLDNKLAEKTAEINGPNSNLTTSEKRVAVAEAERLKTEASSAIDGITDVNQIPQAQTTGENNIAGVSSTNSPSKAAAIEEVELARSNAKAAIEQNNHLSPEQQQAAKDEVDQAATDAIRDINAATDNNGINTAKASGLTGIDLAKTKADAIDAVEAAVEAAQADIDGDDLLNTAEKAEVLNAVKAEAARVVNSIKAQTDKNNIPDVKDAGIEDIVLKKAKELAKKRVEKTAANKEQAITNSKMTESEKQDAIRDVRQAKQDAIDAIDAIDNTHTNTEGAAKQAGQQGETNINNVSTESRAKTDAKNAIDQRKTAKLGDIDGPGNNQTAEEKAATKAEVERLAREAKANIDAATTDQAVLDAQRDGTRVIEGVPTNSAKKDTAVQELGQAQTDADTEIDGKAALSQQDKDTAKQKVQDATNAAIRAAGDATTDADLNTAKTTGTDKVNAIKALAEKQNEVNEAINNNPDLR
ncbi:DUF1542 domain-containing protein, partial [Gemella sp. zg-1178]|uniref:DUF1542 domain-containing protein n=1 Tax=Gemella sp. zg-1178 TaxID=2840372 RepID=UPI001C050C91